MADTPEKGLEKKSERPNETGAPSTAPDASDKIIRENGNAKPPPREDTAQKHLPPLEIDDGAKKAQNAPDKQNGSPPPRPDASTATNSPEPRAAAAAQDAPPPSRGAAAAAQDAPPPSRSAPPPEAPKQDAPTQNKTK